MNNELYHWKYIKREKKNGKWVYTYDTGSAAKKNYQQAKNNLNTRNFQERSALERNIPVAGVKNVAFNKYTHYRYGDKGVRDKLEKQYESTKSEYKKSPIGKKEQRAESLKRGTEKIKNWAKDKVGFDEKHDAEVARTKATIAKYDLQDTEKKNREWRDRFSEYDPETGAATRKKGWDKVNELADWQDNYYRELAAEAESNAQVAESEYKKTALGRYEIASEKISKAVEKGKDRIKNKIGYIEKGISEGRQENVDFYRKKVKEVEDQIAEQRREHPNHTASIEYNEKRLKEYREKLGEANRSQQKARDNYMNTPLGKLSKNEKAYEFVDNMLNGTPKKKRKK